MTAREAALPASTCSCLGGMNHPCKCGASEETLKRCPNPQGCRVDGVFEDCVWCNDPSRREEVLGTREIGGRPWDGNPLPVIGCTEEPPQEIWVEHPGGGVRFERSGASGAVAKQRHLAIIDHYMDRWRYAGGFESQYTGLKIVRDEIERGVLR